MDCILNVVPVVCRRFLRTEVSRERDAHVDSEDDDDDSNGAVEINGGGGEVRQVTVDLPGNMTVIMCWQIQPH